MEERSRSSTSLSIKRSFMSLRSKSFIETSYEAPVIKTGKILALLVMASLIEYTQLLSFIVLETQNASIKLYVLAILVSFYLLYPVLGYIGEKITRYKVILCGIIVTNVSIWIVIGLFIIEFEFEIHNEGKKILEILQAVFLGIGVISTGLFNANIIQFGTDQIQFASSNEMKAFARWFMFAFSIAILLAGILRPIINIWNTIPDANIKILFYSASGIVMISGMLGLILILKFRRSFVIDHPTFQDPVKQIYGVLKFAWDHKHPLRRSAFTYNDEIPSRIDFAKNRYGGPYTSSEVENVKSFWSILAIVLLSTVFLMNYKAGLADQIIKIAQFKNETLSSSAVFFLNTENIFQGGLTVTGIIIFDFVILPFFPRCVLSMLKRMWMGVLLVLISTTFTGILKIAITQPHLAMEICLSNTTTLVMGNITDVYLPPYELFLIPNTLTGLGILIVYVASLEFILAQAPYRMQGLILGFWFFQFPVSILQLTLGRDSDIGCTWEYYFLLTAVQLVAFALLTFTSLRYKPRQCNEEADINVRVTIEKVYERAIQNEKEQESFERRLANHYVIVED